MPAPAPLFRRLIACAIATVLICTSYAVETDNQSDRSQHETTWSEGPETIALLLAGTIGDKPASVVPRILTPATPAPAPLPKTLCGLPADARLRTAESLTADWRPIRVRTIELRL